MNRCLQNVEKQIDVLCFHKSAGIISSLSDGVLCTLDL